MKEDTTTVLSNVVQIDDARIQSHLDKIVRGTVEETLNSLLDAEADRFCNADRYERTQDRTDSRAGHYERKLHTKAGEVTLKVPKLIIADACHGLWEAAADVWPDTPIQGCTVHFYRNVFSYTPSTKVRDGAHMLKAIHASETRAAAQRKADEVIATLRSMKLWQAADLVERRVGDTLNYYPFPDQHWIKLRTNTPLERMMKEIRRRTRVVGAFPDGQSCLYLAAARLRHIAGTKWSTKRYMNMELLYQHQAQAA